MTLKCGLKVLEKLWRRSWFSFSDESPFSETLRENILEDKNLHVFVTE